MWGIGANFRLNRSITMPDFPVKVDAEVDAKGTNQLIEAVVDAFSPATETLGLLGDCVRLARTEVAARVTRRAKQIADENGLSLNAPPLKFLVPFFEKSSLEELGDEDAIERWSQLLVGAATKANFHPHFVSILSEIESSQASALKDIMFGRGRFHRHESHSNERLVEEITPFDAIVSKPTTADFDAVYNWALDDMEQPLDRLLHGFQKRFTGKGIFVSEIIIRSGSTGGYFRVPEQQRRLSDMDQIDLEVLESLNLVRRDTFRKSDAVGAMMRSTSFSFEVVSISELGIVFLSSVDNEAQLYLENERSKYEERRRRG